MTMMTPPQVAKHLGVNRQKVLTWIANGELVAINIAQRANGRGRYRVTAAALACRISHCRSASGTDQNSRSPSQTPPPRCHTSLGTVCGNARWRSGAVCDCGTASGRSGARLPGCRILVREARRQWAAAARNLSERAEDLRSRSSTTKRARHLVSQSADSLAFRLLIRGVVSFRCSEYAFE